MHELGHRAILPEKRHTFDSILVAFHNINCYMLSPQKQQELIHAFVVIGNPDAAMIFLERRLRRAVDLSRYQDMSEEEADEIIAALRSFGEQDESIERIVDSMSHSKQRRR